MRIQNRIVSAFRRNPAAPGAGKPSRPRIAGLIALAFVTVLLVSACSEVSLPDRDDPAPRVD